MLDAAPDFRRDVHCVLGLPFDAVSEAQAEEALRRCAREGRRNFLSTPNLDFAVHCLTDAAFRESVQQSHLSVADGWPIVLAARLLGVPLPERVTGSTLFERLCTPTEQKMSVYFFGGPDGAAEAACQRINAIPSGGVSCVGFDAPGFGSIEEISGDDRLQRINASGADFLVVALGAKKGQAWIRHNLPLLSPPIVSHLGAVVNFAAGTVQRAPRSVQRVGLEWLWRIKEEPALWRRYAHDARVFLGQLFTRVLPLALALRHGRARTGAPNAQLAVEHFAHGGHLLVLSGHWAARDLAPLREQLQVLAQVRGSLLLDLSGVEFLDSGALGLLSLMHGWQRQNGQAWGVRGASRAVRRLARLASVDYLLQDFAEAERVRSS
jgi:N-acetylglucosaminyldiphosphoundecaprenol N-acetyl-beta-D-mannosaminyltransferase